MSDILSIIVPALPFLLIAAGFYALARYKKRAGEQGLTEARTLLAAGDRAAARDRYVDALWNANEAPQLERMILHELSRLYGESGTAFDAGGYETLIGQYETLSRRKATGRAMRELKKVQALKQELIERMPPLAPSPR